jgi:CRISPR-associated protein (TIGR02584 family)
MAVDAHEPLMNPPFDIFHSMQDSNTTLLAVTGLSPAIVTETLWALATRKPRILPRRVAFVTTMTGAAKIESELFTPRPDWNDLSVWESLRQALKADTDELIAEPPHVISIPDPSSGRAIPLDDIRTPAENQAAAEFIFARVWDVVRDKDRHLIASVAGGRKTMGALLHSAVSLIGRENDSITHVLVSPPFDTLLGFFYPDQPECPLHDSRTGRVYEAARAEITLAEVPFVPLRNRFKELDDLPGSFLTLRNSLSQRLKQDAEREIPIRIDHLRGVLEVDGKSHLVRARALAILHFILECNKTSDIPPDQATAAIKFTTWFAEHRESLGHIDSPRFDESDIRRELNHLRDILKDAPWQPVRRTLVQAPFRLL